MEPIYIFSTIVMGLLMGALDLVVDRIERKSEAKLAVEKENQKYRQAAEEEYERLFIH